MKKIFTITSALLLCAVSFAEDYTLYYDATSGTKDVELTDVADLQKITFSDGIMTLHKKDGSSTDTEISLVQRLFFSTREAVGIDNANMELVKPASDIHDLTGRRISASSAQNLNMGIYIIDGKKVYIK